MDVEPKKIKKPPGAVTTGETASKYPDMELSQKIHRLTHGGGGGGEQVLKEIATEVKNPSLYRHVISILTQNNSLSGITVLTDDELKQIEQDNATALQLLEDKVKEAQESAGDMEVLDARFSVARLAAQCLPSAEALESYDKILALPKLSSGKQIDALMEQSRVASFYLDSARNDQCLEKAHKLAEDGGDWDRRNRLKVYNALSLLQKRDNSQAASLFLDGIATFSCNELCSYAEFLMYAMLTNILQASRPTLKEKIVQGPEILSMVQDLPSPAIWKLVHAFYHCNYQDYLHALVDLQPALVADRYLQPHVGYWMRELHVLGFKQFLDSYQSVTVQSMAASFGISPEYLDVQLSRYIAAGRIAAKIDKYQGVVETSNVKRPDAKDAQYREMIQKGDLLLNRIQKLARVVDL
jgi:26S proteasome regulatory subunit N7